MVLQSKTAKGQIEITKTSCKYHPGMPRTDCGCTACDMWREAKVFTRCCGMTEGKTCGYTYEQSFLCPNWVVEQQARKEGVYDAD